MDVKETERLARLHYQDLIDGRQEAVQELIHSATLQAVITIVERARSMTPAAAATSIKQLAHSLESMQQGGRRVVSQIQVFLDAPADEQTDEGEDA